MGTLDGRVLALDARNGEVKWEVEVGDPSGGYSITMAPLIVGENVIAGVSGGEYGIRGHLTAYNMATGKQAWRWYSIPAPKGDPTYDEKAPNGWWGTWAPKAEEADLHRDIAKEKADSAKYADAWKTGGGGVWTTPAYDKETNTIFATVGNPSRTSTAASARATTSSPMPWWPSTRGPERPSGITRPCRTTSGISTPPRHRS